MRQAAEDLLVGECSNLSQVDEVLDQDMARE